ncbi:hypothetical protein B0J14DRAFT_643685 [Halenospora varia]|nr:hypothetical protein B0J14DRAFT_643685 [Halenospora varia]
MTDTLYYVYMKWTPPADPVSASNAGRNIMTFRSRQDADEFFRFCLTATDNKGLGKNLLFSELTREGPQLWSYNNSPYAGTSWELPRYMVQWFPQWAPICMPMLLNDWAGRVWNIIPNQAQSDWTNGAALFIRSKLVTSEYWYYQNDHIWISTTGRTKFIIRATAFKADDPQVLIRDDKVTIELAEKASTTNPLYVVPSTTDSKLVFSSAPYEWAFKDLFNSFGTEAVTDNSVTHFHVIRSPGTSVVWDLV